MKTGLTKTIQNDDDFEATTKPAPTLSMITLRFVTLLAGIVVLLTWAWSR